MMIKFIGKNIGRFGTQRNIVKSNIYEKQTVQVRKDKSTIQDKDKRSYNLPHHLQKNIGGNISLRYQFSGIKKEINHHQTKQTSKEQVHPASHSSISKKQFLVVNQHLFDKAKTSEEIEQKLKIFKSLRNQIQNSRSNQQTKICFQKNIDKGKFVVMKEGDNDLQFSTAKELNLYYQKNNHVPANVRILHSLAHIQFNAFMAYMDTYCTFLQQLEDHQKPISKQFLANIGKIAEDECRHCLQLIDRLNELGYKYGQIPVLTTLSQTINKTQDDLIARTLMISIVHEGKGMQAIKKLKDKVRTNDNRSVGILEEIQIQEVFHYETGLKWLEYFAMYREDRSLHSKSNQYERRLKERLKEQIERINLQYRYKLMADKLATTIIKDIQNIRKKEHYFNKMI